MAKDFKYADLLDDDAFKLVFGQESTKNVMIEFLNQVITDRRVKDVHFGDKEMRPNVRNKKASIYDLLCTTDDDSQIIVELQNRKQDCYAERILYYSMHQILKKVQAGQKSFDFCPIYVISILNFTLDQNDGITDVKTVYRLYEENSGKLLTNRLTYIFIELPKMKKRVQELDGSILEGMCYCLRHMPKLKKRPKALKHKVFDIIFTTSEFILMDEKTRNKILKKMRTERDLGNQFDYARKEGHRKGHAKGRAKGRAETVKKMLAAGISAETIANALGISVEECMAL